VNTNERLPFGKYKGEFIEDVIELRPSYIAWCVSNGILKLNNELNAILNERNGSFYDDDWNPHYDN